MCQPPKAEECLAANDTATNGCQASTRPARPARWRRRGLAALIIALAWYLHPALKHTVARDADATATWRLTGPPSAMTIDVLTSRPTRLRWKRDGGLRVESFLRLRIHNAMPVPLRVRGITMSATFPMLGESDLFEAGFQDIAAFTAPPLGSATMNATYVLEDLRPSMLVAVAATIARNAWRGRPDVLETRSHGRVDLWPTGSLHLRCVLTAPAQDIFFPLHLVNTCRTRLL